MTRRVMLLVETSTAFGRGLLEGIGSFAANYGQWTTCVAQCGAAQACPRWLRGWRGDGVIFRGATAKIVAAVGRSGLPAVDVLGGEPGSSPLVYPDEDQIAAAAIEHLRDRGFLDYAFCATVGGRWVRRRAEAFARQRARRGAGDCRRPRDFFGEGGGERRRQTLASWIGSLARPAAVVAACDRCGVRVLETCREIGVAVPEEVAVLGVGNDELLCRLAMPPLSSVDPDAPRAGYQAAALLETLMAGAAPPAEPVWTEIGGVVARQSTDVRLIDDEDLARALRFIHRHACQGIGVEDVLQSVTVSRATLERRFAARLGRSPRAEILRVRLDEVRRLLRTTSYPLERIAELTAFKTSSHLSVAFKREMGQAPSDYRQR